MGFPSAHTRETLREASEYELHEMYDIADERDLPALKRRIEEELGRRN